MSYEPAQDFSLGRPRIGSSLRPLGPSLSIPEELTSLVPLKSLARQMLPSTSILREILLAQPDWLPRSEAIAKLEIFVQLLYRELGKT